MGEFGQSLVNILKNSQGELTLTHFAPARPLFSFDPQMQGSQRSALFCFPLRNESHIFSRGQTPACWWLGDLHSLTEGSRAAVKTSLKGRFSALGEGGGRWAVKG